MRTSNAASRRSRFLVSGRQCVFASVFFCTASGPAFASTASTHLTIYQSDIALVQQTHQIDLCQAHDWLSLPDISSSLVQDSIRITSNSSAALQQRFLDRPFTTTNLVRSHIGKNIEVLNDTRDGTTTTSLMKVLALTSNGAVLQDKEGRIETLPLHDGHRFRFPGLPSDLTLTPQIQVQLDGKPGKHDLQLRYLTHGLNWRTHYDLLLRDQNASLTSHVSVENHTNQAWQDANITLVAGKINRTPSGPGRPEAMMRHGLMAADRSMAPAGPKPVPAGPYHLYSLSGQYDLQAGESRQIPLFHSSPVVHTLHRIEHHAGGGLFSPLSRGNNNNGTPARVILQLDNGQVANSEAQPWPAGLWRIYSAQKDQGLRLLGEDQGKATPVGNRLSLNLGEAFNVTALRSQTGFKRIDKKQSLSDWRIELRNAGEDAVQVQVIEHMGNYWQITRESHPRKKSAQNPQVSSAVWLITLAPNSTQTLTYQVRAQRP